MNILDPIEKRIDEIKHTVAVAVETAILRRDIAVAISRLKDIDANRASDYAQAQTILGL